MKFSATLLSALGLVGSTIASPSLHLEHAKSLNLPIDPQLHRRAVTNDTNPPAVLAAFGIGVSNLTASTAFYKDTIGLVPGQGVNVPGQWNEIIMKVLKCYLWSCKNYNN
jgi:hypothetical protein